MWKYSLITAVTAFALVSCAEEPKPQDRSMLPPAANSTDGHTLFLRNCVHCHGATARGDEGPDLHNLDWTDAQIAKRIRNGKKGEMTAFEGKLTTEQINTIVAYVRTLK